MTAAEPNAVINQVLQRTVALQDGLQAIANRHVDEAPASAERVQGLTAALSRAVLE